MPATDLENFNFSQIIPEVAFSRHVVAFLPFESSINLLSVLPTALEECHGIDVSQEADIEATVMMMEYHFKVFKKEDVSCLNYHAVQCNQIILGNHIRYEILYPYPAALILANYITPRLGQFCFKRPRFEATLFKKNQFLIRFIPDTFPEFLKLLQKLYSKEMSNMAENIRQLEGESVEYSCLVTNPELAPLSLYPSRFWMAVTMILMATLGAFVYGGINGSLDAQDDIKNLNMNDSLGTSIFQSIVMSLLSTINLVGLAFVTDYTYQIIKPRLVADDFELKNACDTQEKQIAALLKLKIGPITQSPTKTSPFRDSNSTCDEAHENETEARSPREQFSMFVPPSAAAAQDDELTTIPIPFQSAMENK